MAAVLRIFGKVKIMKILIAGAFQPNYFYNNSKSTGCLQQNFYYQ
jgi:hypothetical protein